MNIKKFLVLLLALTMIIALASCKKCKDHVDKDDDYLCDNCGEHFDDGDETDGDPTPEVTTVSVTFNVKLDSGEILEGVKITVSRGEKIYELVSGADGKATVSLEPAAYAISYDHDSFPEFCTPDTFGVKVEEGKTTFDLIIVNNVPDGTARKPFFISENETDITLAPGEELYFYYRGSTVKTVTINEDGISVGYDGETYSAVDGVVKVVLTPEIGEVTLFSVKNETDSAITTVMELIAPLGSNENPIELTEGGATVTVNCEKVVYYRWTADKTGVLTLTSDNERNNISITKVKEGDIVVVSQTNGSLTETMEVNEGDVITIAVSALEAKENHENKEFDIDISFSVSISDITE